MKNLERFIEVVMETRKVFLLQAMEGMFAMLEDDDGNSYIPVWENEALALNAVGGDWENYSVTEMDFSELVVWLKELSHDEIDIAVSPEREGEITAIASASFRKWVRQYADDSYKETDEDADDFDYGDGWAHDF